MQWLGLDQNIRLFEYSFGGLAFDFQFWDSNILFLFFFQHLASPRNGSQLVRLAEHLHQQQTVRQWKTFVLTYSMHIFHEKSSISYKRACRTSTFEIMNLSAQKTQHVNGPSAITKPNAMHAFSFCQLSRDESESLGSACRRDAKPLWESEREKTRYSWITHAVFKWLI